MTMTLIDWTATFPPPALAYDRGRCIPPHPSAALICVDVCNSSILHYYYLEGTGALPLDLAAANFLPASPRITRRQLHFCSTSGRILLRRTPWYGHYPTGMSFPRGPWHES